MMLCLQLLIDLSANDTHSDGKQTPSCRAGQWTTAPSDCNEINCHPLLVHLCFTFLGLHFFDFKSLYVVIALVSAFYILKLH